MDLVERERELNALTTLLDELDGGRSRVALIEGPAGIGKTRLLAATRRGAKERGIRSLGARGSELEREFPFGVARQLIEPTLRSRPDRDELFAGAAGNAAPVFAPAGSESAGDDTSFAVLHGLYWLTLNLVEDKPLLLAIDDLHWCDRPSLRMLAYLARRLEGTAMTIVATVRTTEPGTDPALLAEIAHDPASERIHPGPLSREAMPALIERRLGAAPDSAFARACHEATGGNPLLLDELLKGLAAEGIEPTADRAEVVRDLGPRAVSRAVLLRLARLRDAEVAVAQALAVLGDGAELAEVAALAELNEEEVAEATGQLARVEILDPEPPLRFVHPLVRDAVYNDLAPGRRELEHRRAGRILHEAGAPPERIAAHLLRVAPDGEEWVPEVLTEAARAAAEQGATENAVACMKRALQEPLPDERRARVILDLGLREMDLRGGEAVEHLREAHRLLTEPEDRAWTGYALARSLVFTRRELEAAQVARETREELPADLADFAYALEAVEIKTVYFGNPEVELLERTVPYRAGIESDGPGAKMLIATTAHAWANADGTAQSCAKLAWEALDRGILIEFDNGLFWVTAIMVLIYADVDGVPEIWAEAQRLAHERGSLFMNLNVNLWRGYDLLRRGDLEQAQESLESGLEDMVLWSGEESRMLIQWPVAFLGAVHLERGNLEEAERILARGTPGAEERSEGANFWRQAKIELLLAQGRAEEALRLCEAWVEFGGHTPNPAMTPWRSVKAEVLDRLGRTEEGLELAREELDMARRWGAPQAIGRAERVLGTLERERGLERLRSAVATLERSTARLEHAKALCALGTATRLARQQTEAREPLRRALEIASACSADALVARTRTELGATGARPRRDALGGVESLTPSERRIADMAAEGMTNREIAQALFITPKTVEVHLSNAYRKLDIGSRRELAGALTAPPTRRVDA